MKKLFLVLGLVLLAAGAAQAQFPNTYKTTVSVAYNPNVGTIDPAVGKTPGTLQVTVTFSGSTTQQAMNNSGVHHTPHALVKVNGNPQSQVGPGFLPAQNMGWSYTFSFDLQQAGCDFQLLDAGTCTAEDDSFVTCPMMGNVVLPLLKIQVERANTTSILNQSTRYWNGTTHVYTPSNGCVNQGDFPGPDIVFGNEPFGSTIDDANAAFIRTQDLGWRTVAWGLSFEGVPWTWFNLPRTFIGSSATPYLDMAVAFHLGTCTRKDPPSATPAFNQ